MVGERTTMLSREGESWIECEGRFNEPRACEGMAAEEVSSVSVCGGGEDSGKRDEVGSVAVDAVVTDVATLRCAVVSSSSPAFSLNLVGGTILRDGRDIARFDW